MCMKFSGKAGASQQMIRIRIQIRIVTLVIRALAEVCTVPVLSVIIRAYYRADVLSYLFATYNFRFRHTHIVDQR